MPKKRISSTVFRKPKKPIDKVRKVDPARKKKNWKITGTPKGDPQDDNYTGES